jgi:hypothetical protein
MERGPPERGQEPVQDGHRRARGELRAFMQRRLPELLQSSRELGPHPGRDVAVDAAHAGHLVSHALGLQDVPDADLVTGSERFSNYAEYRSSTNGQSRHVSSSLRFFVATAASCGRRMQQI